MRMLADLRKAHKMTQRQVAEATGKSVAYIHMLETGQRSASAGLVTDLAALFGVSERDLFGAGSFDDAEAKAIAGLARTRRDAELHAQVVDIVASLAMLDRNQIASVSDFVDFLKSRGR